MKISKSSLITLFLIVLNLALFYKLRFFLPLLSGKAQLLDLETYLRLLSDIKDGINPYTVSYMQSLGPPSVFYYFLPFSIFDLSVSIPLYTLTNIICGFATCFLFSRTFFEDKLKCFLILTLIYFSSFPVRFSIEMGQPNTVIGLFLTFLICYPRTKYLSFILSLIMIIKTNYFVLLLSFIKSNFWATVRALSYVAIITSLLFAVIKPSIYSYYITEKTGGFLLNTNNSSFDYYNQSIPTKIGGAIPEKSGVVIYTTIILFIFWKVFKTQNLMLGALASVMASPVSWQHYFAALFPVYLYSIIKTKGILRILSLFAFFLYWIEFPFLHHAQVNLFTVILSKHYLISAMLLFLIISKNKLISHPASK